MAREAPTYRDELEEIIRFFGGKRILTVSDVAKYTGRTRDWTREKLGVCGDVTVVALAHMMVDLNKKSIRERT